MVELFINDLEPYAKFFSVNFIKNKDYVHGYVVKTKLKESLLKNETFGLLVKCSRDKIDNTLQKKIGLQAIYCSEITTLAQLIQESLDQQKLCRIKLEYHLIRDVLEGKK